MVDQSEEQGVLSRIAEDNEFFKRMLSLLPPIGTPAPTEDLDLQDTTAADRKKQKRKEKKREKHVKKIADSVQDKTVPHRLEVGGGLNDIASQGPVARGKHKIPGHDTEVPKNKKAKQTMDSEESLSETDDDGSASVTEPKIIRKNTSVNQDIPVKRKKDKRKKKNQVTNAKSDITENGHVTSLSESDTDKRGKSLSTVVTTSALPTATSASVSEPGTESVMSASISSIEDKRAKLREKIEQLKAKRNPTNRERLDRKKLKRQESKMKLKQKRKLEKLQARQNKQTGESSKSGKGNLNKGASPVKPVYNKEGQLVFSKFDFTDSGKKEKMQTDLHGKDYKRLLEKIEKRNLKINKLKGKDEDAGKALEEKVKWESVLHKAEGEKVKDNPELLKKSLKKKQKMKDQKKKKWENRVEHVEKMKDERQKKRNENIQKRKQSVKDKKMQKLKKKGRILPGF